MKTKPWPSAALAALLAVAACSNQPSQPSPPPDTRPADEAAIRAATAEWAKAAAAKDLDKFLSFYAPGATLFPPNAPVATSLEAIRAVIASLLSTPGLQLDIRASHVEAARSGDLAYETGTYEMVMEVKKGKPEKSTGKYVVVWKKQASGQWKAAADIFNSDK